MNKVVRAVREEKQDNKPIQRQESHWLYRSAKWLIDGVLWLPKSLWSIPKKMVNLFSSRSDEMDIVGYFENRDVVDSKSIELGSIKIPSIFHKSVGGDVEIGTVQFLESVIKDEKNWTQETMSFLLKYYDEPACREFLLSKIVENKDFMESLSLEFKIEMMNAANATIEKLEPYVLVIDIKHKNAPRVQPGKHKGELFFKSVSYLKNLRSIRNEIHNSLLDRVNNVLNEKSLVEIANMLEDESLAKLVNQEDLVDLVASENFDDNTTDENTMGAQVGILAHLEEHSFAEIGLERFREIKNSIPAKLSDITAELKELKNKAKQMTRDQADEKRANFLQLQIKL